MLSRLDVNCCGNLLAFLYCLFANREQLCFLHRGVSSFTESCRGKITSLEFVFLSSLRLVHVLCKCVVLREHVSMIKLFYVHLLLLVV